MKSDKNFIDLPLRHPFYYDRRFIHWKDKMNGASAFICNGCVDNKEKYPTVICYACMKALNEMSCSNNIKDNNR